MNRDCPFCKIIHEEAPADVVWYGTHSMVIRPLGPVNDTHVLFIPFIHVADFAESPDLAAGVFRDVSSFASWRDEYQQANVITSAGPAATQTVMHFHVHLIGREPDDGLTLPWGKLSHEHKMKEQPT